MYSHNFDQNNYSNFCFLLCAMILWYTSNHAQPIKEGTSGRSFPLFDSLYFCCSVLTMIKFLSSASSGDGKDNGSCLLRIYQCNLRHNPIMICSLCSLTVQVHFSCSMAAATLSVSYLPWEIEPLYLIRRVRILHSQRKRFFFYGLSSSPVGLLMHSVHRASGLGYPFLR